MCALFELKKKKLDKMNNCLTEPPPARILAVAHTLLDKKSELLLWIWVCENYVYLYETTNI